MSTVVALLALWLAPVAQLPAVATGQPDAAEHAGHAEHAEHAARARAWDPEVVQLLRTLPVQEGGRVKPLDTQVSFLLLRLNGRRSVQVPDAPRFGVAAGQRLSPMEWALDVLFFPEQAAHYPVFQVQTDDVVHALGLEHDDKRKRDRYSFAELAVGEEKLMALTQRYSAIDEKLRTAVQGQIVDLGFNYFHYRLFSRSTAFARLRLQLHDPDVAALFDGASSVTLSDLLAAADAVEQALAAARAGGASDAHLRALENLRFTAAQMAGESRFLAWLPAPPSEEAWLTLPELVERTLFTHDHGDEPVDHDHAPAVGHAERLACVAAMERLVASAREPERFAEAAAALHAGVVTLAEARGDYEGVELEVALYRADPFFRSLLLFLAGFLVTALGWLRPRSRWIWRAAGVLTLLGTLVLVGGVVVRCVLRGRPPVTTLYETVLFVTGTLVITTLVIEWINRRRVALSVGALLGAAGMFLAGSYERMDGQDTMPTLVAVLDTNFWLATHVTTVTMGYAAGLLAGALGHVYLLGKLVGFRRDRPAFYRNIARMVYGVICFTVLFSVVGTILGGVWANESWGRFWGWDPKENGALMIVLWNLAILHARVGGMIRDFGLCLMAVFGNIVVAFSWWGVNLLGVGLHSYGFTAGVQSALHAFYGVEAGVVMLGGLAWLLDTRLAARRARRAASSRDSVPART